MNNKMIWIGSLLDPSGYGEASRNYVQSLDSLGLYDIKIKARQFWNGKPIDFDDETWAMIKRLHSTPVGADEKHICVQHLTPDNWVIQNGKCEYHIGMTTFETDRIPQAWQQQMRSMDTILTYSHWGKQVFEDAGIRRPIMVVPHGVDTDRFNPLNGVLPAMKSLKERYFVFGSNFDWTERKNPRGLLRAYFSTFGAVDDVCLVLKTYNQYQPDGPGWIRQQIKSIREQMGILAKDAPPVYVIDGIMSPDQVAKFYTSLDAYVLPARGEGWGLCVDPSTIITTRNGFVPMSNVAIGDDVLAEDGCFHRVLDKISRVAQTVNFKVAGTPVTTVTPEHPFLVLPRKRYPTGYYSRHPMTPTWVRADQVKVGDFVAVPRPRWNSPLPETIDLLKLIGADDFCFDESHIWCSMGFSGKQRSSSIASIAKRRGVSMRIAEDASRILRGLVPGRNSEWSRSVALLEKEEYVAPTTIKTNRHVVVDAEFLEFVGWYLAEGSDRCGRGIDIDLHIDELDVANRLSAYSHRAFGLQGTVSHVGNKCRLRLASTAIARMMAILCGRGAKHKMLHPILWNSADKLGPLVNAYFMGDGHIGKHTYSATTASVNLAWQMRHILATVGIFASIFNGPRKTGQVVWVLCIGGTAAAKMHEWANMPKLCKVSRARAQSTLVSDDYIFAPVRSVFAGIEQEVMDISVEDVHSFTGNGLLLHNTYTESMASGLPTIAVDWSAPTEFMNDQHNSLLVKKYKLVEITPEAAGGQQQYVGHAWADCDVDELGSLMAKLASSSELRQRLGKQAREDMVKYWTWQSASHKLHSAISQYGLM